MYANLYVVASLKNYRLDRILMKDFVQSSILVSGIPF